MFTNIDATTLTFWPSHFTVTTLTFEWNKLFIICNRFKKQAPLEKGLSHLYLEDLPDSLLEDEDYPEQAVKAAADAAYNISAPTVSSYVELEFNQKSNAGDRPSGSTSNTVVNLPNQERSREPFRPHKRQCPRRRGSAKTHQTRPW